MTARIIILNGAGSAGKSSIARALQGITRDPFMTVAMDTFLDMLPPSTWDHPDGILFETLAGEPDPTVAIRTGSLAEQALRGMRRAIAVLAAEGNNLIIDDVILDPATLADYRALLEDFDVSWVGIFAPLAVLEERERRRQDRMAGLARWQYERVHAGMTYDLAIDTSQAAPSACAARIKEALGL